MYGIVYIAFNKTSNKAYVGQTIQSFEKRKRTHLRHANKDVYNSHFMRALRKYPEIDWEWLIIAECDSREELDKKERTYIQIYSYNRLGYNTREGGANGKFSEEACKVVSEAMKGKKKSKEHCKAMQGKKSKEHCKNMSDSKNGLKRKPFTKKHHENMSKAQKGKYMGAKHSGAKAVMCIETGIIYGAIKEAIRKTGINHISLVANGKYKTAGKLHWRFV